MENKNTIIWVILIIAGIILISRADLGLFAILPEGEFNANNDCTFITNANYGANGEQVSDYSHGYTWITLDFDGDGSKEAFGRKGSVSSTGDYCKDGRIITYTPMGFRVAEKTPSQIMVCSSGGNEVQYYQEDYDIEKVPIFNCEGENGCDTDTFECDDGTFVSRNPNNNCEFYDCPVAQDCSPEEQICISDSTYKRCLANSQWSGLLHCSSLSTCVNGFCEPDCIPNTCLSLDYECGSLDDGCGGTLSCGSCSSTETCELGTCEPLCDTDTFECPDGSFVSRDPETCEFYDCPEEDCTPNDQICLTDSTYKKCLTSGSWSGILHCSSATGCVDGFCVAACVPDTCSSLGYECGVLDDGCGGTLSCGSCTGTDICVVGICEEEGTTPPEECLFLIGEFCFELWMLLTAIGGIFLLVILMRK